MFLMSVIWFLSVKCLKVKFTTISTLGSSGNYVYTVQSDL